MHRPAGGLPRTGLEAGLRPAAPGARASACSPSRGSPPERRPRPLEILFLEGKNRDDWKPLLSWADLTVFEVPTESYLLDPDAASGGVSFARCLELARAHAGRFDFVFGECTGGFLWHCLFRLAGDRTPFVLLPRFNHVRGRNAYSAFLSSLLCGPEDIVFPGSRAAARSFSAFGFRCDPLYLPGISLELFRPASEPKREVRASLGLPAEVDTLLYTGRVAEDKHVLELLEVFARVKRRRPARLVISCIFPQQAYLERCRRQAAEIGDVEFVDRPDTATLVRYYQAADLFVTAAVSPFETFGRSPVEAMACGVPPVAAEYDGFRDTVSPGAGYLVPTLRRGPHRWPDVEGFAATILAALADRAALAEKSRAGPQQAARFDKRATLEALRARLLARGAAAAPVPARELSLDSYPREVADLWSPLAGRQLAALVEDFIGRWHLPVRPAEDSVRGFYEHWFAHY